MGMSHSMRGIDLRAMKKAENTVIGFEVSEGFINTEQGELKRAGDAIHMAVPALEVTFKVANGERRKSFNITLGSVMPLIHMLSEWGVRHGQATIEDSPEAETGPLV